MGYSPSKAQRFMAEGRFIALQWAKSWNGSDGGGLCRACKLAYTPGAGCYHLNPKNEGLPTVGSTLGLCFLPKGAAKSVSSVKSVGDFFFARLLLGFVLPQITPQIAQIFVPAERR